MRLYSLIKSFYIAELSVLALLLFLFGAFVHLSFDVSTWSMITRIIVSVLFLALILLSQYIAAIKGLRK